MRRAVVWLAILAASCGDSTPPASVPPVPVATSEPLRTGTVIGIVRVESDDVAPLTGSVRGFEKYCGKGPLDLRLYVVDPETKGLAGAYVEADGRSAEHKPADVPVMDQVACLFTPALVVAPPGQVVFRNSDTMAHNVSIDGRLNPVVREGFPAGGATAPTFPFDEKLVVRCSIHPWMVAGLVVTRRSAFALTAPGGTFRIEGVEAGRRRLTAWHPLGEEVVVEVDVPAGGQVEVELRWNPRPGFRAPFGR